MVYSLLVVCSLYVDKDSTMRCPEALRQHTVREKLGDARLVVVSHREPYLHRCVH